MAPDTSIQLPLKHADKIKQYYRIRLSEIQKEAEEITAFLLDMEKGNNGYNGNSVESVVSGVPIVPGPALISDLGEYNPKWPNPAKIKFMLQGGKKLGTGEIVDSIVEREPHLKEKRRKFMAIISSLLGTMAGQNILGRDKDEAGHYAYYLK